LRGDKRHPSQNHSEAPVQRFDFFFPFFFAAFFFFGMTAHLLSSWRSSSHPAYRADSDPHAAPRSRERAPGVGIGAEKWRSEKKRSVGDEVCESER
jgi:hypothetical protein